MLFLSGVPFPSDALSAAAPVEVALCGCSWELSGVTSSDRDDRVPPYHQYRKARYASRSIVLVLGGSPRSAMGGWGREERKGGWRREQRSIQFR